MIGSCAFPTTIAGPDNTRVFYQPITMYAASKNLEPSVTFGKIAPSTKGGYRLFADRRLLAEVSPALSVISSFQAWIMTQPELKQPRDVYLWFTPDGNGIGGASEGLATLLALMGYTSPPDKAVTGVVRLFGDNVLSHEELLTMPIGSVDCIEEKVLGMEKEGKYLGYPTASGLRFRTPYACGLNTVNDAIRFVES